MKRQCWLVGHKSGFNESGYGICSCGIHEYWNAKEYYKVGLLNIPSVIYWKVFGDSVDLYNKYFSRCYDCNKFDIFWGRKVGNHEKCLPF